ncbi:MAG: hypothetical protein AB1796_02230 [Bacillota bacterium]
MQTNTTTSYLGQALLQQQTAIAHSRMTLEAARGGDKTAGAAAGSFLNFRKVLAVEIEKHRRSQHLRQEQKGKMKNAQPLLMG